MKQVFIAAMLGFALFDAMAGESVADQFDFKGSEILNRIDKELGTRSFGGLSRNSQKCHVGIIETNGVVQVLISGPQNIEFTFALDETLTSFLSGDEYVSSLQIIKKVGNQKAYLQVRTFSEEFGAPGKEVSIFPLGDISGSVTCRDIDYR